jgi:chromosome segregation ATPase
MARTNRKSSPSITLFPFLSILACVMGTLTLIIYGVALGQTPDPNGSGASPEDYQQVSARIAEITAEIEHLEAMIAAALEREKKVSDLKNEVARVQSMLPGSLEQLKLALTLFPQYEELKRQVKLLEEQLEQSCPEFDEIKGQIEAAQKQLDVVMLAARRTRGPADSNSTKE